MSEEAQSPRTLHDRLFKEFLHRFLPDFLWIFFPCEAERLNFTTLRFLDKELIINFPDQELPRSGGKPLPLGMGMDSPQR